MLNQESKLQIWLPIHLLEQDSSQWNFVNNNTMLWIAFFVREKLLVAILMRTQDVIMLNSAVASFSHPWFATPAKLHDDHFRMRPLLMLSFAAIDMRCFHTQLNFPWSGCYSWRFFQAAFSNFYLRTIFHLSGVSIFSVFHFCLQDIKLLVEMSRYLCSALYIRQVPGFKP